MPHVRRLEREQLEGQDGMTLNSPLSYFGGKSRLAKTVISRIPRHTCYVEPFCGAAWVFFKKPESKAEVLNDLDNNIVNVYRVIQHHPEERLRQLKPLCFPPDLRAFEAPQRSMHDRYPASREMGSIFSRSRLAARCMAHSKASF
jgi:site-specific DNA-adenine methylase